MQNCIINANPSLVILLANAKSDYTAKVEHRTIIHVCTRCIIEIVMLVLGNEVGGVRVSSLEDLGELFIHPLHKHKDVPMDLVRLVRRLRE